MVYTTESLNNMLWTPAGRTVQVVLRDCSPYVGASSPSLQPQDIPPNVALEGGGDGNELECGQVSERAEIGSVLFFVSFILYSL